MRCATIASNVGGIPYIIEHGVTGLLFEPQNAEALGGCMARLAESAAMRAQLGENLYEKASREFFHQCDRRQADRNLPDHPAPHGHAEEKRNMAY